jgi:pyruvate dehydrogenase E1 component alpha subunit
MTTRTKEESAILTAALAGNHGFSLISNEKLLQLYTSMVKCRMIETRKRDLMARRKLDGNCIASMGREAAVAGVAIDLELEDCVAPSSSNLLVNLIKGLGLDQILSSLLKGSAGREPIDDQLTTAVDVARSNKRKKNAKIVVVFCDGEAASMASWKRALDLAGAEQLPMLFVSYSKVQAGAGESASLSYGFPSIPVDGGDVVAVYRVATEAIAHARKGSGATLIECVAGGSEGHANIDPILKMEAYLSRKGLFSERLKREVAEGFRNDLDDCTAAVETAH